MCKPRGVNMLVSRIPRGRCFVKETMDTMGELIARPLVNSHEGDARHHGGLMNATEGLLVPVRSRVIRAGEQGFIDPRPFAGEKPGAPDGAIA